MNTPDIEARLNRAAAVATPPRSIVDDVMSRLPLSLPVPARRFRWRYPVLAAFTGIAAAIAFIFLLTGPFVRITLADVQAAVQQQLWVHVRFDTGQINEHWINLQTGETYATRTDGGAVYVNEQANTRLVYWKNSGVIDQDTPTIYAPGQVPSKWTPQTAWEQIIAPFEKAAATIQPADSSSPSVVRVRDSLNGNPLIRFDYFGIDNLGQRFLYAQLWADPRTRLPVRIKTRLQLAEREEAGKEWSTGDYDFPRTGPADLFALGVPRGTPIKKEVTTAPGDVRSILDAINRNHDGFLKNYRAIVVSMSPDSVEPLDAIDVIWRDGDKVRQDHHLPPLELQDNRAAPLANLTPASLLAWAAQHEPIEKQLMDSQHEYSWTSAVTIKASKPQVLVRGHGSFPLLATNAWPEEVQWPTRYISPDFHLLAPNAETLTGCIGLRSEEGNTRADYYVDPKNDYLCVKQIRWTKRGAEWTRTREYVLSDLRSIDGHVVAGTQQMRDFGDGAKHLSASAEIVTIDIVPFAATDYPAATFDPAALTTGAKVVGY